MIFSHLTRRRSAGRFSRALMCTAFISAGLFGCANAETPAQTGPTAPAEMLEETLLAPAATEENLSSEKPTSWTEAKTASIIKAIESLENHGLTPSHYHLAALKDSHGTGEARIKLAADAWLSAAAHLSVGKLDPVSVEPDWTAKRRELNFAAAFAEAQNSGDFEAALNALAPQHDSYQKLKAEYAALRTESEQTVVTTISEGDMLKKGMTGPRVTALQTRLTELGYLEAENISSRFDDATHAAIKAFQAAQELDDDGVAGAGTIRALNRGLQGKVDQLRVNLERLRWLPDDLGKKHLRANIAGFSVTAYNNGVSERTHLVIVGKSFRKTPVFSDQVEFIVFNPWWETPHSLASKDKLPSFQKDPSSVERLGFDIYDRSGNKVSPASVNWNDYSSRNFPFRIRQKPGDSNALGKVKIMFPNAHNVYLHDTPTKGLFAQRQRAFSSGCLRTQNPIDLSEWLLADTPSWDRARIDKVISSGQETRATLSTPIPVHILYQTTIVEPGGGIRYLDDIYSRDQNVLTGLNKAPDNNG